MNDDVYLVNPLDIIEFWVPGDYMPMGFMLEETLCDCYTTIGYHDCDSTSVDFKWNSVLINVREDNRYDKIYNEIKTNGFKVPIAAKWSFNDVIMLVDGHHRLAAALDLELKTIPVFIGDEQMSIFDLRAVDSGWWDGKTLDSPFLT